MQLHVHHQLHPPIGGGSGPTIRTRGRSIGSRGLDGREREARLDRTTRRSVIERCAASNACAETTKLSVDRWRRARARLGDHRLEHGLLPEVRLQRQLLPPPRGPPRSASLRNPAMCAERPPPWMLMVNYHGNISITVCTMIDCSFVNICDASVGRCHGRPFEYSVYMAPFPLPRSSTRVDVDSSNKFRNICARTRRERVRNRVYNATQPSAVLFDQFEAFCRHESTPPQEQTAVSLDNVPQGLLGKD